MIHKLAEEIINCRPNLMYNNNNNNMRIILSRSLLLITDCPYIGKRISSPKADFKTRLQGSTQLGLPLYAYRTISLLMTKMEP